MAVDFYCENVDIPDIDKNKIIEWLDKLVYSYKKEFGDLAIIFCNDEYILSINNQYLKHNYYTDIISFDYSFEDVLAGDLFISLDTVYSNSIELQVAYLNEELLRVICHGVFHLLGFKDKTKIQKEKMRSLENEALILYNNL